MQLVADPLETNISEFLLHHGVFRPDSKTTKLRVVFNASSKTTSSLSLNDILYKGEILQQDLFSILLRFRQHTFVFTTDISKMFRQILINPGHRNLQLILWKDSVDGPVQTYKLNTVTYGTTCAPYLATRTIQQLARDEGEHYPLAASVTIRDIYMGDILTGSSDFQEFQKLQLELISLFKKAGIIWSPQFDYFSFKTVVNCRESYTKREVLSIIARLFDPLGFLGPILTQDKLILQKLWVLKLEWDEPLSNPIAKEWNDFVSTLPVIQNIHVHRLVIGKGRIIIHGFADASTAAYGAVLYAQSISEEDVSTRLLCSKSRVAPVKPITIPRLELCACVLLSQLLEKVLHSLTLPIQQIMLWTDSNIVLAWIQRSPEQLKTFIGNRIKIIQRLTQNCQWNHVSSNENPADLISRGLNASDISSKQLWWHGPDFLREELEANPIDFERITSDSDYLKELKPANIVRVQYFVRGGFVGHRPRASSKHLSSHLPVDGLDSSGCQKGVALQLQDARVGVESTKKPTTVDVSEK
ncbi:integrase catalytic domain-containing protein [Trichonephila clavipes]|nr:integrase catalytic domain-containing protein [Trichonephila clavipes]